MTTAKKGTETTPKEGDAKPVKKKRGRVENLHVPTSEEAREMGRRGGLASARARQQRKSLAETLDTVLKMPVKNGKFSSVAGMESIAEAVGNNMTVQDVMIVALSRKAMEGDVRAIEELRVILGESPQVQTASPLDILADEIRRFKDDDDDDDASGSD